MIKLNPSVPTNHKVSGNLYSDADHSILGEDMVDVLIPNGVLISCGWYPEGVGPRVPRWPREYLGIAIGSRWSGLL